MDHKEKTDIRLVVKDEHTLYSAFSPEDEFSEPVKAYIRSKITDKNANRGISLTVISQKPIDEAKFRAAVAKWIRDEKTAFRINERNTIRRLIFLLAFGSLMILLCLSLEKNIDVLKYSLLPIMGSLALGRAASILVLDMPSISAQRWLLNETEKASTISFEYGDQKRENA